MRYSFKKRGMDGIAGATHPGTEISGKYLFSDLYLRHPAAGFLWFGVVFLLIMAGVALTVTPLGFILLLGLVGLLLYLALRDVRTPVVFFYSPTGVGIRRRGEDIAASWSRAVIREKPTAFVIALRIPRGLGSTSGFVLPKRWMSQHQMAALTTYASAAGALR